MFPGQTNTPRLGVMVLPSFSGQRWLLDSIADVVATMMFSRAVLVSQEGVNFGNTTGLVVVDTTPHVGNFLEGYLSMHQTSNVATHSVPIFESSRVV